MVFICLDGALGCVDAMVCWFYELPFAILLLEEGFDGLGALVIGDVKGRFVPFIFQLVEYRFECLDDGLIFQIVDWFRKYVVGIVVIRDEEVLHAIEGADR